MTIEHDLEAIERLTQDGESVAERIRAHIERLERRALDYFICAQRTVPVSDDDVAWAEQMIVRLGIQNAERK